MSKSEIVQEFWIAQMIKIKSIKDNLRQKKRYIKLEDHLNEVSFVKINYQILLLAL